MKIKTLNDLYVSMLRDMYNGEKRLIEALPKLAKSALSTHLKQAIVSHLEETETHAERLERIFEMLGQKATGETCEAMKGLIEECDTFVGEGQEEILDAGIIAYAQKVEHYEIATYGSLCEYAKMLGLNDQLSLLQETLEEEKSADKKLNEIAISSANWKTRAA